MADDVASSVVVAAEAAAVVESVIFYIGQAETL